MTALEDIITEELRRPVLPLVARAAQAIAARVSGSAVLFYGSVLRTGDLDGVLDFYVLRGAAARTGLLSRLIWPDVSYHEVELEGRIVRAKVATMRLATFERAARGATLDTTIWARFVQPSALIWAENETVRRSVATAVANAAVTASWFTTLHCADVAAPGDFWRQLFRATYSTELRVEAPGREDQILSYDRERYDRLLPLAWRSGGIAFDEHDGSLMARPTECQLRAIAAAWLRVSRAGKWLNLVRLAKAAFTFEGAARYGLWKIERHTGVRIALTPFRERHPILAAPGVFWRVWRRTP
ncbi:hypothetical protein [Sphingomonas sp. BK580]|uniref:hypothetical protein n=1 Tax=Sphingomonas sp. BK580 TaxID=2586972 RepID=UPI001814A229|nr:hypothetical protein [Sphingomonas sp. BK580]MBB3693594.1 hypothetical protein [Sphingomonas sp. BK580]